MAGSAIIIGQLYQLVFSYLVPFMKILTNRQTDRQTDLFSGGFLMAEVISKPSVKQGVVH